MTCTSTKRFVLVELPDAIVDSLEYLAATSPTPRTFDQYLTALLLLATARELAAEVRARRAK